MVSTGYCVIEKKNSEERVVNVNVVTAQNSSCSPIVRRGSVESSAKLTARLDQRKDETIEDISQDHSALSTEEKVSIVQKFVRRILRVQEKGAQLNPRDESDLRTYISNTVQWVSPTSKQEDLKLLEKDFEAFMHFVDTGECNILGCPRPGPCGKARRPKALSGLYLFSAWECLAPGTRKLILKEPHSDYLMPRQSQALDETDKNIFHIDAGAGGCRRKKCKRPLDCMIYRQSRKRLGVTAYTFSRCIDYLDSRHQERIRSQNLPKSYDRVEKQGKTSPTLLQPPTEDDEVTFYDFETGYFITFLAKKSEKLKKTIDELKEIKSQADHQRKRQEIVEIILTTPPGPGEE